MKKNIVFAFVAALVMAACSNQETIETAPAVPTAKTAQSNTRSYDEALKIAENAIGMLEDSNSTTRNGDKCRKIDLSDNKVIMRDAKTRGESDGSDSLIYVFNFENDEGFALVSASKNTDGLLAVTEQGHCDPETPSGIDGFDMFVDMAKEYVLAGMNSGSFEEIKDSIIVLSTSQVGPYVTVKWGQTIAEGESYPNNSAGCANIAMAQIMSYYKYPTQIKLSHNNNEIQNLNWNKMCSHDTRHYSNTCSDIVPHLSISQLCRELGVRNNSKEESGETTTITCSIVHNTYSDLGYSNRGVWDYNYNGPYYRAELDNHHLIHVTGLRPNSLYGHDWVFDGYLTENCRVYSMHKIGNVWHYTDYSYPLVRYYNHYNWGWYGCNNGFFLENVYQSMLSPYFDDDHVGVNKKNRDYGDAVSMLSVYPNR